MTTIIHEREARLPRTGLVGLGVPDRDQGALGRLVDVGQGQGSDLAAAEHLGEAEQDDRLVPCPDQRRGVQAVHEAAQFGDARRGRLAWVRPDSARRRRRALIAVRAPFVSGRAAPAGVGVGGAVRAPDGDGARPWVVLGEGAQAGVPRDLLQDRQRAADIFEFADAGVAQLIEGPAGGNCEQFGGAPVRESSPAGGWVPVGQEATTPIA
jgi:hypothetical protein